jgi:hypothetical protein
MILCLIFLPVIALYNKHRNYKQMLMKYSFLVLLLLILSTSKVPAQGSLYARTNLQLAIDAEGYWVGPQAGLGVGIKWPRGWGIVSEYYGFKDKVDIMEYGWFEKGFFNQQTLALMGSYSFGKKNQKDKGFYLMGGLAYQIRKSEFKTPAGDCPDNMEFFTPAFEFGRRWPVSKSGYGIAASLKFTGPITYNQEPHIEYIDLPESGSQYPYYVGESSTLEILTQLSIGIVVDRVFPLKKKK